VTINVLPVGAPTNCPCSLWDLSTTPAVPDGGDGQAVEIGVKFQSQVSGFITGLRFYKSAANVGTHTGHIWTSAGAKLAEATFTDETATGWQRVTFATPVPIEANTTYVASYHAPSGHYAAVRPYFDTPYVNAPLTALADGTSGGNGVYLYTGAPGAFPSEAAPPPFNATNYFVDVEFATQLEHHEPTANNDTYTVAEDAVLTVAAPGVLGNDTDPDAGTTLTASLVAPPSHGSLTFNVDGSFVYTPTTDFVGLDTFTYRASDGALQSNTGSVTITVGNPQFVCPCTIWSPTDVPADPDNQDPTPVEVGASSPGCGSTRAP
jgi:hypothetical protein